MNDYTGLSAEQDKKLTEAINILIRVCEVDCAQAGRNIMDFLWALHFNGFISFETVRYYLDLMVSALSARRSKLVKRKTEV